MIIFGLLTAPLSLVPRLLDPRGRVWTNGLPFLCSQGISIHVNTMYSRCTCSCFISVGEKPQALGVGLRWQDRSLSELVPWTISACQVWSPGSVLLDKYGLVIL